jgi:hypothetical protein
MNTLTIEELEKKREKQRIYNKKYYDSHSAECRELHRLIYKEKIQNKDYKEYLYKQHKASRDKLKEKINEENNVVVKKRGRPKTLPFFMDSKI